MKVKDLLERLKDVDSELELYHEDSDGAYGVDYIDINIRPVYSKKEILGYRCYVDFLNDKI